MIFITVGMHAPFDRLVRTVDAWSADHPDHDVFAQIGPAGRRPEQFESADILDPSEYRRRLLEADVIVTHAGVGTILTALGFAKPMILLPRRADEQEAADDHQVLTARALDGTPHIRIVESEVDLGVALNIVCAGQPGHRAGRAPAPGRSYAQASVEVATALERLVRENAPLVKEEVAGPTPPVGRIGPPDDQADRKAA